MNKKQGRPPMSSEAKLESLKRRLWAKVVKHEDGCWVWIGLVNPKGYGRIGVGRNEGMRLAHRVAWELTHGAIPVGKCVLHKCDVPACVNPEHLFLGDRADNNVDMMRKGRANFIAWKSVRNRRHGSQVPNSRLTEAKVRLIRIEYESGGTSFEKLAKKYNVGSTTIEHIVKRRKWAHVE